MFGVSWIMATVLVPCRVPWVISSSMSGVTVMHSESDVEPECSVVFGAGRLTEDARIDSRRVELAFKLCYYIRTGPHDDSRTFETIGYTVQVPVVLPICDWHNQWALAWRTLGYCPDSSFYVAQQSDWITALPTRFQKNVRHYVVDGRDGYVELIAQSFKWREWLWKDSQRECAPSDGPVVGEGEGVD